MPDFTLFFLDPLMNNVIYQNGDPHLEGLAQFSRGLVFSFSLVPVKNPLRDSQLSVPLIPVMTHNLTVSLEGTIPHVENMWAFLLFLSY